MSNSGHTASDGRYGAPCGYGGTTSDYSYGAANDWNSGRCTLSEAPSHGGGGNGYNHNEHSYGFGGNGSQKVLEKCANPRCFYLENSDPSISFSYCCAKCEGRHKGEEWAQGGKQHYKDCEKVEASQEAIDRAASRQDEANFGPTLVEATQERKPLERHEGAQRDTRPAWMTKGVGVNTSMFGETKGDMLKPGMTKEMLEKLEQTVRSNSPDPMSDFLKSANTSASPPRTRSRSPAARRAPLPDQSEQYYAAWDPK